MASRWTSFQRGFLLILNWNSCSGSETFLIWSLSLMKYLVGISSLSYSSVSRRDLTPVLLDLQERQHQEGDPLDERRTSCFNAGGLALEVESEKEREKRKWRMEKKMKAKRKEGKSNAIRVNIHHIPDCNEANNC